MQYCFKYMDKTFIIRHFLYSRGRYHHGSNRLTTFVGRQTGLQWYAQLRPWNEKLLYHSLYYPGKRYLCCEWEQLPCRYRTELSHHPIHHGTLLPGWEGAMGVLLDWIQRRECQRDAKGSGAWHENAGFSCNWRAGDHSVF